MQKFFFPAAALLAASALAAPALAQTPAPRPAAPRARPPTAATQIIVRDQSGTGLDGVRVSTSGAGTLQITTDAKGMASATLPPGTYRLRFERQGFITLERDVTIRAGQPAEVAVALDAAIAPPPPPVPAPAPPPAPAPAPKAAAFPSGPPANVSIPQFLEKNYIGRDPLKESVLGCTAAATTRVLQLRDSLASHTHADLDEIIYVVAGEGVVRVRDQMMMLAPGTLTVIPRGLPHSTERRGRNPLILISTLAGAPCSAASNGP